MTRTYNPDIHDRRSQRLRGYDYAQSGAYFVTMVSQGRECLFGEVVDEEMRLNAQGEMARKMWEALPNRFPSIEMDEFVVMPNHIHAILVISHPVGAPLVGAPRPPTTDTPTDRATNPATDRANDVPIDGTTDPPIARATTRVAPTTAAENAAASTTDQPVGAPLVGAPRTPTTNEATDRANDTPTDGANDTPTDGANDVPIDGITNPPTTRATTRVAPTTTATGDAAAPTLGEVVGAYKSLTTVEYARGVRSRGWQPFQGQLWQRNYYDHVVRDYKSLDSIRQYIRDNPAQWAFDSENPLAVRPTRPPT